MLEFINLYEELQEHMKNIYGKFLEKHTTNPLSTPEEYNEDVKAYCILAHAYLEEYFEEIASKVKELSLSLWFGKDRRITKPLLTLLSYSNHRFLLLTEKEKMPYQTVFDRLKKVFEDTDKQFSAEIYHNHGASEKYLRNLLGPVSIDISQNPRLLNSLFKLADARGSYAHKNAKKTIAPEDAKKFVEDCLELCLDIERKAVINFHSHDDYEKYRRNQALIKLTNRFRAVSVQKERLEQQSKNLCGNYLNFKSEIFFY